jgi:two-component system, chemotaxis family, response regulator PixH
MAVSLNMKEERPLLLIVDDEPTYLQLLACFCGDHGYEVATSAAAGDGVQKALLLNPGVILMDVTMPGLTGWAALQQLKSDPRTSTIPVVMMTGNFVDTSASNGPQAQASAVLMKPIPPAVLIETLERVRAVSV